MLVELETVSPRLDVPPNYSNNKINLFHHHQHHHDKDDNDHPVVQIGNSSM